MKPWFLRLHRWVALIFALPLIIVLATGLVLSFEPGLVTAAIPPGALTVEKVRAAITEHDPQGQARAMSFRAYDGTLTLSGRDGGTVVDVATGQRVAGASALSRVLGTARGLHETLLLGAGWLVIASTVAMLVIILLGMLMGLPRINNTLSGWHKAMAWGLLPLIILSPLSGLFLALGISFTSPAPPPQGPMPKLIDAAQIIGRTHDLSNLVWLRPLGPQLAARMVDGGEYRIFAVTSDGLRPMQRNWPRLWHEGNFAGMWSAAMNVIISLAMIGLLVTGIWIWARRRISLARRKARRAAAA